MSSKICIVDGCSGIYRTEFVDFVNGSPSNSTYRHHVKEEPTFERIDQDVLLASEYSLFSMLSFIKDLNRGMLVHNRAPFTSYIHFMILKYLKATDEDKILVVGGFKEFCNVLKKFKSLMNILIVLSLYDDNQEIIERITTNYQKENLEDYINAQRYFYETLADECGFPKFTIRRIEDYSLLEKYLDDKEPIKDNSEFLHDLIFSPDKRWPALNHIFLMTPFKDQIQSFYKYLNNPGEKLVNDGFWYFYIDEICSRFMYSQFKRDEITKNFKEMCKRTFAPFFKEMGLIAVITKYEEIYNPHFNRSENMQKIKNIFYTIIAEECDIPIAIMRDNGLVFLERHENYIVREKIIVGNEDDPMVVFKNASDLQQLASYTVLGDGMLLYSNEDYEVEGGTELKITTGVYVNISKGTKIKIWSLDNIHVEEMIFEDIIRGEITPTLSIPEYSKKMLIKKGTAIAYVVIDKEENTTNNIPLVVDKNVPIIVQDNFQPEYRLMWISGYNTFRGECCKPKKLELIGGGIIDTCNVISKKTVFFIEALIRFIKREVSEDSILEGLRNTFVGDFNKNYAELIEDFVGETEKCQYDTKRIIVFYECFMLFPKPTNAEAFYIGKVVEILIDWKDLGSYLTSIVNDNNDKKTFVKRVTY